MAVTAERRKYILIKCSCPFAKLLQLRARLQLLQRLHGSGQPGPGGGRPARVQPQDVVPARVAVCTHRDIRSEKSMPDLINPQFLLCPLLVNQPEEAVFERRGNDDNVVSDVN